MRLKRRGYVMTWDAILALIFIILVFVGLLSMEYSREMNVRRAGFLELYSRSGDAIEVLNKMGALENIVAYWSENDTEMANKTATFYLEQIIPGNIGYLLEVGNDTICQNLRIREEKASDKTKATRLITGYAGNKSREFIARAWLLYNNTGAEKSYSIANVSYERGFSNADGCEWLIEYVNTTPANENVTIKIPEGYGGSNECSYTGGYHSKPGTDDAINDAIYRILDKLDTDGNGVIDPIDGMPFNETSMTFKTANITTSSLTDAAEVNLILWMR